MPVSPISTFLRAASRQEGEKLNILCAPVHEAFESNWVKSGHNFYAFRSKNPGHKDWETKYRPVPDNYTLLPFDKIPLYTNFDLVVSHQKFGNFQTLLPVAKQLNLPFIQVEHTLPAPFWDEGRRETMTQMRGDINVFITEYSIKQWRFEFTPDVKVIRHCIDTDLFKPSKKERKNIILSVVNDWINRDWCCGFKVWQRVTQGLPVAPVGETTGLSRAAKSIEELVSFYQQSKVFINTSTVSPIPTSLLEAMSSGCACVSTNNCAIPEYIEHGVNGFITNDEKEMREYLELLLKDDKLAEQLGNNARKTIEEKCNVQRFTQEWNEVFNEALSFC